MTPRRIYLAAATAALVVPAVAATTAPAIAAASPSIAPLGTRVVIEWNRAMISSNQAVSTPGPVAGRAGAIVHAAIFDAVNGITGRFQPYFDKQPGPAHASAAAAAIGAAHEALSVLFPADAATYDALQTWTVRQLRADAHGCGSIARGLAWGHAVADDVLAWRATDGYTDVLPPYTPTPLPGRWQPTPPAFAMPAFRQFATMVPFTMTSPAQFLPPPPPALTSRRYARDYNEVKNYGSATSTLRSAYGTESALLWQSDSPADLWNQVADRLLLARRTALPQATRLLARMNLAMGDAAIAVWNAKNRYDTWRPITAIEKADTDGNPATQPDPSWQPLNPTPPFQEYPSGHVGLSSAAANVMARTFGPRANVVISTPLDPGVVHRFTSFRAALAELVSARVLLGIHFRFAGQVASNLGRQLARWIVNTQMNAR